MIEVSGLSKSYGEQVLLADSSFSVSPGERIGIVARNGHGKSTLFRILLGEEPPDSGTIYIPKHYKLGHLSQRIQFSESSILAEAALGLPTNDDGWQELHKAEAVLSGLGFEPELFESDPATLSGGFQVRLNLCKLLVSDANMLLLDEPTNYLDIVSLRWLEQFLNSWPGELLLITHDRAFMDAVSTHTMAIHRQSIRKIMGDTDKLYTLIEEEEEHHEKTRQNQLKQREQSERFIQRFRSKASKARQVQSKIKALERSGNLEGLENIEDLEFQFRAAPFPGKKILEMKSGEFSYPENAPLFQDLGFVVKKGDRVAIIGKNGKGKTSLLRVLAGELSLNQGSIVASDNLEVNYFGQTNIDRLDPEASVESEIQSVDPLLSRTTVRSICGAMMFQGDLALKQISVLSGGERSRVLLGKLLASPCNLLLLDEPTNHLDIYSSEAFSDAIQAFDGTVMLVTHDEQLLRDVANRLIIFDRGTVRFYEGTYDEFLERIGWETEANSGPSRASKGSKKESRQQRAKLAKEKKQFVKQEQTHVSRLEKSISLLESSIAKQQQELIEGTKEGYSDEMAKLSRFIHRDNEKRDKLYQELELAIEALEHKEQLFDKENE